MLPAPSMNHTASLSNGTLNFRANLLNKTLKVYGSAAFLLITTAQLHTQNAILAEDHLNKFKSRKTVLMLSRLYCDVFITGPSINNGSHFIQDWSQNRAGQ